MNKYPNQNANPRQPRAFMAAAGVLILGASLSGCDMNLDKRVNATTTSPDRPAAESQPDAFAVPPEFAGTLKTDAFIRIDPSRPEAGNPRNDCFYTEVQPVIIDLRGVKPTDSPEWVAIDPNTLRPDIKSDCSAANGAELYTMSGNIDDPHGIIPANG